MKKIYNKKENDMKLIFSKIVCEFTFNNKLFLMTILFLFKFFKINYEVTKRYLLFIKKKNKDIILADRFINLGKNLLVKI